MTEEKTAAVETTETPAPAPKLKRVLGRKQILDSVDVTYVNVEIPEWGGVVRLRSLTGAEALKFVATNKSDEARSEASSLMIAISAVNDDGANIFTEEDVKLLKKKNLHAIMTLQRAALKLNGMDEPAEETKKD